MQRNILVVATTALLAMPAGSVGKHDFTLVSGMLCAFAVALNKSPDTTLIVLTTIGSQQDGMQDMVRRVVDDAGIIRYSQPDARVSIQVAGDDFLEVKAPKEIIRDDLFFFDPNKIPFAKLLHADVAVFVGGPTSFEGTARGMIEYAQHLAEQGSVVVVDIDPRRQFKKEILEEWAHTAHIFKIATHDMPYFPMPRDEIVKQILTWGQKTPNGARVVCITDNEKGSTLYWNNGDGIHDVHVPVAQEFTFADQGGAGNGYDAGLALYCASSENATKILDRKITPIMAELMGRFADGMAGWMLQNRNAPVPPPHSWVYFHWFF